MVFKKIKFCILSFILLTQFAGIKSYVKDVNRLTNKPTPLVITPAYNTDDYNSRISNLVNSATILVPEKTNNGKTIRYRNEADREENDVHHHYEYPESSWKQQHQTPKIIVDDSMIPLNIEKEPVI